MFWCLFRRLSINEALNEGKRSALSVYALCLLWAAQQASGSAQHVRNKLLVCKFHAKTLTRQQV